MQSFGLSMLWFWIGYILVTCVGIVHTIINIYIFGMKPMDENGMGEGYEATKPWHPLYNIILFTIFGFLLHHEIYMSDARKVAPEKWKTVIRHPIKKA